MANSTIPALLPSAEANLSSFDFFDQYEVEEEEDLLASDFIRTEDLVSFACNLTQLLILIALTFPRGSFCYWELDRS
jgi:hypothetical protein